MRILTISNEKIHRSWGCIAAFLIKWLIAYHHRIKTMSKPTYYRKDYRPSDYQIDTTELTFELFDDFVLVTSSLSIRQINAAPLVLNGLNMELMDIAIDGEALSQTEYTISAKTLTIHSTPKQFILMTKVKIKPQDNLSLEGLYRSGEMFCTQCESHGFRKITYYLDRPDCLSTFTTTMIADGERYPIMLSNGNLLEDNVLDDGRRQVVWHDPHPKPSYLFALVAGDLACIEDSFTTRSGRQVTIQIYAFAQDIEKCTYGLEAVKDAMGWDEQRFDLEYDLDRYMIVAVPDFNMGAMENKGLNLFNTKYVLADAQTATDKDFELVQAVIGHEYFHNWTGNRVTCRDWFQLSLKEGLTVFRDEEFTADMHTRAVKRIEDVKIIRSAQFAEDASPMAHPIRPDSYQEMNNFYTVTVYNKGAEVIRMMHTILGEDGFQKGMKLYFNRHDGEAVTCDDFVQAMQDANHYDLTQFKRWYAQAGTPVIQVNTHYDAQHQQLTLTLTQHCPDSPGQTNKQPFYIPIKLGVIGYSGEALLPTQTILLREAKQTVTFDHIAEQPVLSLLRDFSAPVKLDYDLSDEALMCLFSHDTDAFNRWDAGQQAMINLIRQCVEQPSAQWQVPPLLLEAIKNTLHHPDLDPAFIALAIQVPTLSTLIETYEQAPLDQLVAARHWLVTEIAQQLQDCWVHAYHLYKQNDYQRTQVAIAKRALHAQCLYYLAATQRPQLISLVTHHYQQATNMTDRMAALTALANVADHCDWPMLMDEFYVQWQHDALVVDKWLALQAHTQSEHVFDRVSQLTDHPAFDTNNPNKVYSLLVAFSRNEACFHQADGATYRWLVDWVLKLDQKNPMVAARVVRPLINWRRYQAPYGVAMQQTLQALSGSELSTDVTELVEKALQ